MESNIIMLILGVIITLLGVVNIKGDISTVHWYNRQRVAQEDVPKYGRAMGIGSITMGVSVIITAVLLMIVHNEIFYIISAAGIAVGLGFSLYAQIKYNKGIF